MRPPSTVTASAASSSALPRPTHFLALRLGNPALHAHVAELQRAVIARSPSLADCAVPPVKSHLTTFVLHAPDEEAVSAAAEALNACRPLAAAHFAEAPRVQLRGLSSFGRNVLYADVVPDDDAARLRAFVAAVTEEFVARGADRVRSVCVTPDGLHVVTGSWDKTARVWLLADGAHMRTL